MKFQIVRGFDARIFLGLLWVSGCSKQAEPPKPIAIEQAPASLEEAFQQPKEAASEVKQDSHVKALVNDAVQALRSQDYAKALFALQTLSGRSDLTQAQRDFVTRALLSVHQVLEERASSGDQRAQEALDLRRRTK